MSIMIQPISSTDFLRRLSRGERSALRHGATDELEELREELVGGVIDLQDPVIVALIDEIPGIGPVRLAQLLS